MKSAPFIFALTGAGLLLSASANADGEKAKGYELKNRSSFHSDIEGRVPFWPIGWKRPGVSDGNTDVRVVAPTKVQLLPEHFSVTSILLGNPALATINGRSFGEGELLPVVYGTERLRVVVRAIRDGGVTIEHEEQQIFVPMRRVQLGAKQVQASTEPAEFVIRVGPEAKK